MAYSLMWNPRHHLHPPPCLIQTFSLSHQVLMMFLPNEPRDRRVGYFSYRWKGINDYKLEISMYEFLL